MNQLTIAFNNHIKILTSLLETQGLTGEDIDKIIAKEFARHQALQEYLFRVEQNLDTPQDYAAA